MSNLLHDLRYAARLLLKSPGLSFVIILSLALGIGLNSAIFSLVNGFLFRPLPVDQPDQIGVVFTKDHHGDYLHGLSYPDYVDLRDRSGVAAGVVATVPLPLNVANGQDSERLWCELVSGNYFSVLGVKPVVGRSFLPEEDRSEGASPVVMVSERFWDRRFGPGRSLADAELTINGHAFRIVGVAPASFTSTFYVGFVADLWIPASMHNIAAPGSEGLLTDRSDHEFRVLLRLKPGESIERAQTGLTLAANQLATSYPDTNKGVALTLFPELRARPEPEISGTLRLAGAVFMGAVGLVLLIACANVANLLLARAVSRRREIAVRLALGASRSRLIQQLITETLLLAVIGGGIGLLLGAKGAQLLARIQLPTDIPMALDLSPDVRVIGFTIAVSLLTGILFGLAPAWQASSPDIVPSLKTDTATTGWRSGKLRLSNALVVAQVMLSLLLLVCGGLFYRSLQHARSIDPGFNPRNALLGAVDVGLQGYDEAMGRRFQRQIMARLAQMPGVESATMAHYIPLDFRVSGGDITIEGRVVEKGTDRVGVMWALVDDHYFRTMGSRLVAGRDFTARDDEQAARVVIVNQAMAARFWPGQDAIGRIVHLNASDGPAVTVIGVAKDGKYRNLGEAPMPFMFMPLAQNYRADVQFVLRTVGSPMASADALRREVQAIDSTLAVYGVRPVEDLISGRSLLPARLAVALLMIFGSLGLVLAVVGLYGVVAYSVSRRTREVGIRMALGAARADVVRMIVRQGLTLAFTGIGLGIAASLALGPLLSNLLYGINPRDTVTLSVIAATLAAVALVASYLPARRASRIEPTRALHYE